LLIPESVLNLLFGYLFRTRRYDVQVTAEFYSKGEQNVAAARPMTLQDRVLQIDHIQARRFSKLTGITLDIATEGIIRHLRACVRMDVNPDASAVREIIDDALNGRRVFAETSNDLLAA
jgi:hypothetical protein